MTSTLKVDELQNSLGGSGVKVGSLKHPDASGTNITLASDGSATINQISSSTLFPAGHVIQIVSSPNKYIQTISSLNSHSSTVSLQSAGSTDWEVTISNVKQNNNVLVFGAIQLGRTNTNSNPAFLLQMKVDSGSYANVDIGASEGNRTARFGSQRVVDEYSLSNFGFHYLTSPSISGNTGTIKLKLMVSQGTGSSRDILINHNGENLTEGMTGISVMTAMEIQA